MAADDPDPPKPDKSGAADKDGATPKPDKPGAAKAPAAAAPSFSGKLTLGADAGKGEATLLCAQALWTAAQAMAAEIAARLPLAPDAPIRILVEPPGAPRSFAQAQVFELAVENIVHRLGETAQALDDSAQAAIAAAAPARHKHEGAQTPEAEADMEPPTFIRRGTPTTRLTAAWSLADFVEAPALAAAGPVLDVVSRIGALAQSDYDLGGVSVAPDEPLLRAAVAGALARLEGVAAIIPDRRAAPTSLGAVETALAQCATIEATALSRTEALQEAAGALQAVIDLAKAPATRLRAAHAAVDACKSAIEAWRAVLTSADALVSGLLKTGADGTTGLEQVVRQLDAKAAARPQDLRLFAEFAAAVGGYLSRRNLWSVFSGAPFKVMGGVVLGYTLVDGEGRVRAAGVIPIGSGYVPLTGVADALDRARLRLPPKAPWWDALWPAP
jgi:hypothetical protein